MSAKPTEGRAYRGGQLIATTADVNRMCVWRWYGRELNHVGTLNGSWGHPSRSIVTADLIIGAASDKGFEGWKNN